MSTRAAELTLAMAIALESCESDIARVCTLLGDSGGLDTSRELAQQLLGRALRRIETVRAALGGEHVGAGR